MNILSIEQRLQKAITDKVFPGCVFGFVTTAGERTVLPFGHLTYEPNSPRVTENTIYDLASITKSLTTTSSLLKLIDEKKVSLDDALFKYVPAFANFKNKKAVLISHLLTYTIDLDVPPLRSLLNSTPDALLQLIIEAPLKQIPGSTYLYNNATAILMGLVVERVSGMSLENFAQKNFYQPLGMTHTSFHPKEFDQIAPTEIDTMWRKRVVQGEAHDESAFILSQKYTPSHAGLFSTVPDILNFLEMLLQQGQKDGVRFFSKELVEQMHTNQLSKELTTAGKYAGLGWALHTTDRMGTRCSEQAFAKSGFTGTIMITDPVKGFALVLLSNRTYPTRPPTFTDFLKVSADIADIIFG